jgi:hypothetical protein
MRLYPVVGRENRKSPLFGFSFFTRALASFLAVLFVGGGAVTFAAQSSLPGDKLYGVKIASEKAVMLSPVFGADQKTKFGLKFAERRVDELEDLKGKDRLSDKTTKDSMKNYSEMVGAVSDEIGRAEKKDGSGALKMALEAESRLRSQKEKIGRIVREEALDGQEDNVGAIEDKVFDMELKLNILDPEKIDGHEARGIKPRIKEKIELIKKESKKLENNMKDTEKVQKEDAGDLNEESIKKVEQLIGDMKYKQAFEEAKKTEKDIRKKSKDRFRGRSER